MSLPSKNARVDDILAELRRQNWRLETSGDGCSYRCFPPDPSRRMVSLSTRLANGNAVVEILRHLRHQGFVWPPPDRVRPVEPVVRSVPFPPRPSPAVETSAGPVAEVEAPPPAPSAVAALSTESDLAYLALKDAKEYVDLAAAELRTARAECDAAEKRLAKATEDYKHALSEMGAKKDAFDKAFSGDGET